MKKILILSLCLIVSIGTEAQKDSLSRWPAFTFKTTASANMYFGLKKKNYHGNKILKTPPAIGPELSVLLGLRLKENASIYTGIAYSLVPFYFKYRFEGTTYIYAPGFEFDDSDYFLALNIYSLPVSFEYVFTLHDKHKLLTEVGIAANYNATYSYSSYYSAAISGYPPYFEAEIYDNNGLKWYPSGFLKLAYLKTFKKHGAFSAGIRFSYSAAVLGKGYYKFQGFEGDDYFNGDLRVPVNALSFDFAYHFRHTRPKKQVP